MKLKKAIIGISLAAVFLLSGCSQKEKKADPVLNKTQVVQKMKKGFKMVKLFNQLLLALTLLTKQLLPTPHLAVTQRFTI